MTVTVSTVGAGGAALADKYSLCPYGEANAFEPSSEIATSFTHQICAVAGAPARTGNGSEEYQLSPESEE